MERTLVWYDEPAPGHWVCSNCGMTVVQWKEGGSTSCACKDRYPHQEGDVTVLGPEIFASNDGKTICWQGRNYVPQDLEPDSGIGWSRDLVQHFLDHLNDPGVDLTLSWDEVRDQIGGLLRERDGLIKELTETRASAERTRNQNVDRTIRYEDELEQLRAKLAEVKRLLFPLPSACQETKREHYD